MPLYLGLLARPCKAVDSLHKPAVTRAIESKRPDGIIQDSLVCQLLEGSRQAEQLQATLIKVLPRHLCICVLT